MVNVVVVGGGFAGLSAAARLAKLRHDVTLLEAGDRLGGRLHGHVVDGHAWPLDVGTVTLPGVFRDLFRKSGRPLERVVGLEKTFGRRHVFKDGSVLDLPLGNRGDQHEAVRDLFGEDEWSPWVDRFNEPWDLIRRTALDEVFPGRPAVTRSVRRMLRPRRTIQSLGRELVDERLGKIVLDPVRLAGLDRRSTPAFVAVTHYVERSFGRWRFDGGMPALADALEHRLGERAVTVSLGETGVDVVRAGGRKDGPVTHVLTDRRTLEADVVVWCAPTRPLTLPPVRTLPVIPASRTLLTLGPAAPALPDDVLVHANPPLRMWSAGDHRWTVEHHSGEDPVVALARLGVDLRPHVESRTTLTPSELVQLGHWGWRWDTWTSALDRPGVAPTGGLYFAGAHAHPGGTPEAIGMATAAIAAHVGPASR